MKKGAFTKCNTNGDRERNLWTKTWQLYMFPFVFSMLCIKFDLSIFLSFPFLGVNSVPHDVIVKSMCLFDVV